MLIICFNENFINIFIIYILIVLMTLNLLIHNKLKSLQIQKLNRI